jgi:phosphatidylserine/phosphatidylglycerophosphate/cardiolipin synthase-like enzyme
VAKFLSTTATNYRLEELIKDARERLIIISPYLKFNERFKTLLEDKDRMKIDVRIVYGKSELAPQEINWLGSLESVRTSFRQNLHAKCYLNEQVAIITSMNLYEFSQINNDEMGVFIVRDEEPELYRDVYEEAQRIIRSSQQVRLAAAEVKDAPKHPADVEYEKLTSSKLARAHKVATAEFMERLIAAGLLVHEDAMYKLTDAGKAAGGEFQFSKQHGPYFLWPKELKI